MNIWLIIVNRVVDNIVLNNIYSKENNHNNSTVDHIMKLWIFTLRWESVANAIPLLSSIVLQAFFISTVQYPNSLGRKKNL